MKEVFKDIIGYETLYQVSNLGNVKSLPKGDGNGNRERLLKFDISVRGATSYHRVTLCKEGKTKRFQVHQLVAVAFLSNPDNKLFVNHIDNNGQNNSVINLEWCTQIENMKHSSSQGRQDLPRSLGGIAAAKVRSKSYDKLNEALVGTTVGQLTITAYYRTNDTTKQGIAKFSCTCSCGNKVERLKYNLLGVNKPKMCNECSFKQRGDKDIVSTAQKCVEA